MSDAPVLIVGAGVAGLSAAVALAEAGLPSIVTDQAPQPGGMLHRRPVPGVPAQRLAGPHPRIWDDLMTRLGDHQRQIEIRSGHRFAGIDHTGTALLTGPMGEFLWPRALILATGARERVLPRRGWTLPGVRTAGSIQIHLKTTGEAPAGRILLAGSGPLLYAVGAQLARAGTPPAVIVEAARPFSNALAGLGLRARYLAEAAGYMATLLYHRVPILSGAEVEEIAPAAEGLRVTVSGGSGPRNFSADIVGLHDGISSNDYGAQTGAIPVVSAGDCREVLGARAAAIDGDHAGRVIAARLAGRPDPRLPAEFDRERAAQAALARMFRRDEAARLAALSDDTVICRCEMRTLADLHALGPAPTVRDIRLNGRFAMGACQGRSCGEWIKRILERDAVAEAIGLPRWPVRPVAIADILDAEFPAANQPGE